LWFRSVVATQSAAYRSSQAVDGRSSSSLSTTLQVEEWRMELELHYQAFFSESRFQEEEE
jgi:hypothetical protein